MSDVFISYKKEDLSRVEPIARALAQAGYDVWWDHRIPAGRTYRQVIGAALQSTRCVIVVWSSLSVGAQWVLDEADEGKRRNVLLPLLIDDVEIPYGFRQIEAARLVGWRGDVKHPEWQNVLSSVTHFVGRGPGGAPRPLASPSDAGAPAAPREGRRGGALSGPLLGLLVGALLVGGGYYAWSSGLLRLPAAQSEIADASKQEAQSATTTVVAENTAPPHAQRREPIPQTTTQEDAPATQSQASPTAEDKPAEPAPPQRRPPPIVRTPPLQTQPAPTQTSGPRACRSGFVWREARPSDFVCVTPESRARVRQENATASQRVNPQGAYGPNTCISGYVWREAYSGDPVCVTPEVRTRVREENALAASRTT